MERSDLCRIAGSLRVYRQYSDARLPVTAGESVPADALMFEAPGHDRTQLRALDGRLHSGDDSSASAKG
jgi:hypothetical protein